MATEALDALGRPELRETLLYARRQARGVTAAEVAEGLGVPRTAARFRLERLAAAGLLATGFERRSGRSGPGAGRPAKTYSVAPETEAIEFPRRHYEELLRLALDALPRRGRDTRLTEIGIDFGRALAHRGQLARGRSTPGALDAVCRSLGRLGFQAAVVSASPDGGVLETQTCPLRPLIGDDPAARAIDQGMWAGLIEEALPTGGSARVACESSGCHACDSPCRVQVRVQRVDSP